MDSSAAVRSLAALAQDTRLAAYRLLVQAGPDGLCVGDLQARLRVPPATLSFHLKELCGAGLIRSRQEGRFIYYAPQLAAMNRLLGYLTQNCCGGAPCGVACAPAAPPRARRRARRAA